MIIRNHINTKMLIALLMVAVGLIFAVFASGASAHNAYQDHMGACALSTTSVKKGVKDLKHNGVLGQFAKAVGVHGFDGSLTKQMNNWLVVGKLSHAVNTHNTGCDGSGGTFGAGIRHLYKGELVAVKVPAKYGKEACKRLSHKCKPVRIVVNVVFPVSCWNRNRKIKMKIVVIIGIRPKRHGHKKNRHHKHHKKTAPSCAARGLINGPNGSCVTQTVTVTPKQECEASNHSATGCTQTTTTVVINCGNYSSGNTGTLEQGDNCTQKQEETCVNNSCNSTPPPEEHPCGCKPQEPTIKITSVSELNMIPAGKTSGPVHISLYASEAGGVLTVNPGIGSVSSCESSTPEGTFTTSVPAGASEVCVIFYAPEDADRPSKMKVTMTACLGSVCNTAEQEPKIEYPTRP